MARRNRPRKGFDVVEFLGTDTSGGTISYWAWGVAAAGLIALYGLACVLTQSARFIALRPMRIVEYTGSQGVALGLSYLAAAAWLHSRVCWSEHEQYHGYAALAQAVSLFAAAAGMVYLVVDVVLLS